MQLNIMMIRNLSRVIINVKNINYEKDIRKSIIKRKQGQTLTIRTEVKIIIKKLRNLVTKFKRWPSINLWKICICITLAFIQVLIRSDFKPKCYLKCYLIFKRKSDLMLTSMRNCIFTESRSFFVRFRRSYDLNKVISANQGK